MQQLQPVGENRPQGPEGRRLGFVLLLVETGLHHLNIPVTEFLPDKVIELLYGNPQLKLIHIGRYIPCQCIHF